MTGITLAVALLGLITFLYRFSFISPQGSRLTEKVPAGFLKLLGPATFSAIIANHLLMDQGSPDFPRKLAVVPVALLVAFFSRSTVLTLFVGLALLHLLQNSW